MQNSSYQTQPPTQQQQRLGPRNVDANKVTKRAKRDPLPVSAGRTILSYILQLYRDHKHFDQSFWTKALDKWIQVHHECQRDDYGGIDALKNWFFHNRLVHKKIVLALSAPGYAFEWIDERVVGSAEQIRVYLQEYPQGRMAFPKSGKFQYKDLFDVLETETEKHKKGGKGGSNASPGECEDVSTGGGSNNTGNSDNGNGGNRDGLIRYPLPVQVHHLPVQRMDTRSDLLSPNHSHSRSLDSRSIINTPDSNSNASNSNGNNNNGNKQNNNNNNVSSASSASGATGSVVVRTDISESEAQQHQPQINQRLRNILIPDGFNEFEIGPSTQTLTAQGHQGHSQGHHQVQHQHPGNHQGHQQVQQQQQRSYHNTNSSAYSSNAQPAYSKQTASGGNGGPSSSSSSSTTSSTSRAQRGNHGSNCGSQDRIHVLGGNVGEMNGNNSNNGGTGSTGNNNGGQLDHNEDSIDSLDTNNEHNSLQRNGQQHINRSSYYTSPHSNSYSSQPLALSNSNSNSNPSNSSSSSSKPSHYKPLLSIINSLSNPHAEKIDFVGSLIEKDPRFMNQLLEEVDAGKQQEISTIVSWFSMYRQRQGSGTGNNGGGGGGGVGDNGKGGSAGPSGLMGLLGGS